MGREGRSRPRVLWTAPFPAGGNAFIRIVENQSAGNAGNTAYASVSWTAPSPISIVAAGGYTRQPGEFRDGWRAPDANTFVLTLDDPSPSQVWLTNGSPLMSGQWVRGIQTATYGWSEQGSGIRFERLYVDNAERWGIDHIAAGAPGGLRVTSANPERYLPDFGASFSLPPNQGSPIARVHYRVIDATGDVVQPVQVISATNPTELKSIAGPAATAPIPRDTTPPAAPQEIQVAASETPRSQEGFDLRWRNIVDAGSPIDTAHYQVRNGAGDVVVPTETMRGDNVAAIADIETPKDRGTFTLRLWLSDAEGNVGAPVSVPLSYECMRSSVGGGQQLSAELDGAPIRIVEQGQGATLHGELRGTDGDVAGAGLCIFSQVAGEAERQFLGIAITGSRGDYRFAIGAGPSRILSAVYRPGQRRLSAEATLQTRVKPTLRARSQVIRTGEFARLEGEIPGPRNDDVVIVLQVRQGDGWLAFRRYKTRGGGQFEADYLFRRTARPTTYEMRAQVRETTGYPYLEGDSDPIFLRVLPKSAKGRAACVKAKRWVARKGKGRCVPKQAQAAERCAKAKRALRRRPSLKRLQRRAKALCAANRRGGGRARSAGE